MENKKLYIGLGLLAIAGIGIYLYNKKNTEKIATKSDTPSTTPEKISNIINARWKPKIKVTIGTPPMLGGYGWHP